MRSYFYAAAVLGGLVAPASLAAEVVVNSATELTAALSGAANGDIITITPAGSPYIGSFSTGSADLTVRGSTGDPADVVIQGSGQWAMRYPGGGAGQAFESLTFTGVDSGLLIVNFGTALFRVENCVFDGLQTGLRLDNFTAGPMEVVGCVFRNISVDGLFGLNAITVRSCLFENNSLSGSAINQVRQAPIIEDCVFIENHTTGDGGAIFSDDGFVSLRRNAFIRNSAQNGGAIKANIDAGAEITDNLFARNTAAVAGGAIAFENVEAFIERCTFVDNTAPSGSAIHVIPGAVRFPSVWNSIFWNVDAPVGSPGVGAFLSPEVVREDWVLLQGGGSGPRQYDFDPLFVDPASENYRLQASSPALDGGCVYAAITPVETATGADLNAEYQFDLDGADRTVDADNALGGCRELDLGCYEFQPAAPCVADLQTTNTNPGDPGYGTSDGTVDGADLSYYVEQWLAGCP